MKSMEAREGQYVVVATGNDSESNGCSEYKIDREDFCVVAEMMGRTEEGLQHFLQESPLRRLVDVRADENDRRISKINMNCIATLPGTLGRLESLTHLEISSDHMTAIPPSIGKLRNLRSLTLHHMYKVQELPNEIGDLAHLNRLAINRCEVKSLPPSIGRLQNLEDLHLSDIPLNALPDEVGKLTKLKTLYLKFGKFSSLPASIGQLQNLRELCISDASLEELPRELGNLTRLKRLRIEDSNVRRIPDSIGQLENLEELRIGTNPFHIGESRDIVVPRIVMERLARLRLLDLSGTTITLSIDLVARAKNLLAIGLCRSNLPASHRDNPVEFFRELARRCRFLGCIAISPHISDRRKTDRLDVTLAYNRARYRTRSIPPGLWPDILDKPTLGFQRYSSRYWIPTAWNRFQEVTVADARYALLRGPLFDLLLSRNARKCA